MVPSVCVHAPLNLMVKWAMAVHGENPLQTPGGYDERITKAIWGLWEGKTSLRGHRWLVPCWFYHMLGGFEKTLGIVVPFMRPLNVKVPSAAELAQEGGVKTLQTTDGSGKILTSVTWDILHKLWNSRAIVNSNCCHMNRKKSCYVVVLFTGMLLFSSVGVFSPGEAQRGPLDG